MLELISLTDPTTSAVVGSAVLSVSVIVLILGCTKKGAMKGYRKSQIPVAKGKDFSHYVWKLESLFNDEVVEQPKIPVEVWHGRITFSYELGSTELEQISQAEIEVPGGEPTDIVVRSLLPTADEDGSPVLDDLLLEASILAQFDHSNVMSMIGVATTADSPTCVIYKYCEQGPLIEILKARGATEMDHMDRALFGQGIANGMKYLDSLGYVHRDLSCRTVLLDSQHTPVVTDFQAPKLSVLYSSGRRRNPSDYRPLSQANPDLVTAVAWSAPEVLESQIFSSHSAVYAYGVTMLEILLNGGHPYGSKNLEQIEKAVLAGKKPGKPAGCSTGLYSTIKRCLATNPTHRPTFGTILNEAKEVIVKHRRSVAGKNWVSNVSGGSGRMSSHGSIFRNTLPIPMVPASSRASQQLMLPRPSVRDGTMSSHGSSASDESIVGGRLSLATVKSDYVKQEHLPKRDSELVYQVQSDVTSEAPTVVLPKSSEFEVNWDNKAIRETTNSDSQLIKTNSSNYGNLATIQLNTGGGRVNIDDGEDYTMVLLPPETIAQRAAQSADAPIPIDDENAFTQIVENMTKSPGERVFSCTFCDLTFSAAEDLVFHQKSAHPLALNESDLTVDVKTPHASTTSAPMSNSSGADDIQKRGDTINLDGENSSQSAISSFSDVIDLPPDSTSHYENSSHILAERSLKFEQNCDSEPHYENDALALAQGQSNVPMVSVDDVDTTRFPSHEPGVVLGSITAAKSQLSNTKYVHPEGDAPMHDYENAVALVAITNDVGLAGDIRSLPVQYDDSTHNPDWEKEHTYENAVKPVVILAPDEYPVRSENFIGSESIPVSAVPDWENEHPYVNGNELLRDAPVSSLASRVGQSMQNKFDLEVDDIGDDIVL